MNFVNVGLGNYISYEKISAIVSPDSAPIRRLAQDAKDKGLCIDATYGRRTRAIVVMDNGQVVLSSIQPDTIIGRNGNKKKEKDNG